MGFEISIGTYYISTSTYGSGKILIRIQKLINIRDCLEMIPFWCIFASKYIIMARQSISFTKPNDEWLKEQVNNEEYSTKSELVNDLIRQARKQQVQIDWIKAKLVKSENSGFTDNSKEQILKLSKSLLNG